MSDFIGNFVRGPDGSWMCVRSCSQMFHTGRIKFAEGATFRPRQLVNGIDVASFLDHRHAFASGD
jgi:hypothetical protein